MLKTSEAVRVCLGGVRAREERRRREKGRRREEGGEGRRSERRVYKRTAFIPGHPVSCTVRQFSKDRVGEISRAYERPAVYMYKLHVHTYM